MYHSNVGFQAATFQLANCNFDLRSSESHKWYGNIQTFKF